jgi:hypothetical protein
MGTINEPGEKAGAPVLIRLEGKEHASSPSAVRRDGVQVIEVKRGEKIVWENAQDQICRIVFTSGGCAFGHGHGECHFNIGPKGARNEDIVSVEAGRDFVFSVQFDKDTNDDQLGTPKIIVTG